MIRKVSVLMALITVMAVIAVSVGVLELNPLAAQATPTASRSFSPERVDAGGQVTVTITAEGYGAFGDVAETLPAGFIYSSSNLPDDQVTRDGQTVAFALLGGTPPPSHTPLRPPGWRVLTPLRVSSAVSMQTSTHSPGYKSAGIPA